MKRMKKILNNNKGFTLIELLAVIVVLAILMVVAGSNVFNIINDAGRGTFRTEFLSLIQATNAKVQIDIMNGEFSGASEKCYNITEITQWDNKNKYIGSIAVTKTAAGTLSFRGWMSSSEFIIEDKDGTIKNNSDDIKAASGVTASTKCGK